jgi:hypothetical protein
VERGEIRVWATTDLRCAHLNGRPWKIDELFGDADAAIAESNAVLDGTLHATIQLLDNGRIELSVPGHGPIAHLISVPDGADWPTPKAGECR